MDTGSWEVNGYTEKTSMEGKPFKDDEKKKTLGTDRRMQTFVVYAGKDTCLDVRTYVSFQTHIHIYVYTHACVRKRYGVYMHTIRSCIDSQSAPTSPTFRLVIDERMFLNNSLGYIISSCTIGIDSELFLP